MLERFPTTVWVARTVEHRPSSYKTKPRAHLDWEFGGADDCYQGSRWEPLKDLRVLEPLEVLAMTSA